MKILMIGMGSIGQRHLRNIKYLYKNCEIYALRKLKRNFVLNNKNQIIGNNLIEKYKIKEINKIHQINNLNIDVVFINSPSSKHLDYFNIFLKNKIHMFIEKPLTNKSSKAKLFLDKISKNKDLKIMIGHQLRFNDCLNKIKDIINKNVIGEVCGANIYHGENIKNFHVYEDYKGIYAAKKNLGGGVLLSQIHEIDYCLYLFGKPSTIYATGGKSSNLDIDVEDYVNVLLKFKKKKSFSVTLTLDYLQIPKKRELYITGTKGSLRWDYYKDKIHLNFYNGESNVIEFKLKDRNELFIKEIRYFFNAIKKNTTIESDYKHAYKCLEITEKIKESMKTSKVINFR